MASAIEQGRLLLASNEWANLSILAAAGKLTPDHCSELARKFAPCCAIPDPIVPLTFR